ncbi:MAG TPA: peptidase M4 [Thermoanaerobaculia bacterium]|nr:peptidase M4 [Thermoanaerobaculia bacterium]
MADPKEPRASTPDASAAMAMSDEPREHEGAVSVATLPPAALSWQPGKNLTRWDSVRPYRRRKQDPLYRPLRIYALDPTTSKLDGAVAIVNVPWEPLRRGPVGRLFEVRAEDSVAQTAYESVDLDEHAVLLRSGHEASPTNPLFHQQMVYAVASLVYNTFRTALGRDLSWGFQRRAKDGEYERLILRPFGHDGSNAFYDPADGDVKFGYFTSQKVEGRNLPGGYTFTALSHDIVAHELSHAMLDGLRSRFLVPSNRDVLAFHEAFADLVALFQHFSYKEVVRSAIRKSHGKLSERTALSDLAAQFGQTTGAGPSLRTAADFTHGVPTRKYRDDLEAHKLGEVLIGAVFHAFTTVYDRKVARYVSLASSRNKAASEMPSELQEILSHEAAQLASQFLSICIRAVDYCPPIDITFGEFLRAVITADTELVADDPWAYREAWIDAFREREIFPSDVPTLSEDALLWRGPRVKIPPIEELSFANLHFNGDPGQPMNAAEVEAQAAALARVIGHPDWFSAFGLARGDEEELEGDPVEPPKIESIRSSRRIGPDEQILFDLVAEVTQKRTAKLKDGRRFPFYGGATIVFGPDGEVRYTVVKKVTHRERLEKQRDFITSPAGAQFWSFANGELAPVARLLLQLHSSPEPNRSQIATGS